MKKVSTEDFYETETSDELERGACCLGCLYEFHSEMGQETGFSEEPCKSCTVKISNYVPWTKEASNVKDGMQANR